MKWVATAPATAIPCGNGHFEIDAPSAAAAEQIAKVGAGAYVASQVAQAATRAIARSPELIARLSPVPGAELVYTLGQPEGSQGSTRWRIAFDVFALPRQPQSSS